MKYLLEGAETERLKFRLLQQEDYAEWIQLFRAGGVSRFLALDHLESAEQQCDLWFEKVFERYRADLGGLNALIDKQTGQLIGQCGLLVQEVNGGKKMEIGYSILPRYWRQGYALEAARKCRDEAFDQRFSDQLVSIIHEENTDSIKVAQKNGMQLLEQTVYKGMPVHIYGIDRDEWLLLSEQSEYQAITQIQK
jgi:RimJ/RimL family protein N-acetyltransferase